MGIRDLRSHYLDFCGLTDSQLTCFRVGRAEVTLAIDAPGARSLAGHGANVRCWLDAAGHPRCDTRCLLEVAGLPDDCVEPLDWDREVGPLPDVELLQLEIDPWYLACGIHLDHTLECWGSAYDDTRRGPSLRELTPPGERWRDIAVGGGSICGITMDDRLLCWGTPAATEVPAF